MRMQNLTPKQRKFVTAYLANGGNGRLAAEDAGYKGNAKTLRQVAYENLRKPDVQVALAGPLQKEEQLHDLVVQELRGIALADTGKEITNQEKLRALDTLCKALHIYKEGTDIQINVAQLVAESANSAQRVKWSDVLES